MTESDLTISLRIIGRTYRLRVKREEEEIFRQAALLIDKSLKQYADNYSYKDEQDLLTMVLLENVVRNKKIEKNSMFSDEAFIAKLENIDLILTQEVTEKES